MMAYHRFLLIPSAKYNEQQDLWSTKHMWHDWQSLGKGSSKTNWQPLDSFNYWGPRYSILWLDSLFHILLLLYPYWSRTRSILYLLSFLSSLLFLSYILLYFLRTYAQSTLYHLSHLSLRDWLLRCVSLSILLLISFTNYLVDLLLLSKASDRT